MSIHRHNTALFFTIVLLYFVGCMGVYAEGYKHSVHTILYVRLSQDNSPDTSKFRQWEDKISGKITEKLYSDALTLCKNMEREAIKVNSVYWLHVSYYYQGVCKHLLKDYKTSLYYFQNINKHKPFDNEAERMVKLYRYMGDVYRKMDVFSEAIAYYKKCLEFEEELEDLNLIAMPYFKLGMVYSAQSEYMLARENYLKGLELIKDANDRMVSLIYNNLGNDEYSQGSYHKAIGYYMQSIHFSEKLNDLEVLAFTYNNIGNIYSKELKDLTKAIEYYAKSLVIEKKRDNKIGIAIEQNNLGSIYTDQLKFADAERLFIATLEIYTSIKDSGGIALTLENMGVLFSKQKNYNKSLTFFLQSIDIRNKINNESQLANVYNNVGAIYFYRKDMDKALIFYFKALGLAKSRNDKSLMKAIYSGIHEAYANLGQYDKAYIYFKAYSDIKDTILNATIARQVVDIQEKYEKTKNEQKIALQRLEITNKSLQRNGVLVILVLSVFAFGGTIHYIRRQRKNEKLLYEQNSKIKEQEIQNLLHQSEIQTMVAKAEGEEKERQRISQELHDRVGSMLTLIKFNLSSFNRNDYPFIGTNLELLENTYKEVRDISHNLYNGLLGRFGLMAALKDLRKTVEANNPIRINLMLHNEDIPLPKDTEVAVFRVLQELIANALKHSKASNLDIQINITDEDSLIVTVEDDGVGFDPSQLKDNGLGLKNIQYRILSVGGSVEINSAPAKGTCIVLTVPITVMDKNNS